MRSNDPSGGMKDIVRSFSKRARRTHLTEKERGKITWAKGD
uniref:AP-1 complex subunit mu-2 n=1 Tax=Rhizophora mucronata TaxID=61149 RepID=A0A2P2KDL8_RHIMU